MDEKEKQKEKELEEFKNRFCKEFFFMNLTHTPGGYVELNFNDKEGKKHEHISYS